MKPRFDCSKHKIRDASHEKAGSVERLPFHRVLVWCGKRRSGVCALVTQTTKWVTAPGHKQHPSEECGAIASRIAVVFIRGCYCSCVIMISLSQVFSEVKPTSKSPSPLLAAENAILV